MLLRLPARTPLLSGISIYAWTLIHRWTSLICTGVLLILCVSGFPLIFHEEIDTALGYSLETKDADAHAPIGEILGAGATLKPDGHVQFIVWPPKDPGLVVLVIGETPDSAPMDNELIYFDASSKAVLADGEPKSTVISFFFDLHSTLFLGPAGPFVLGLMSVLFLASVISGVVLYAPFMRRLRFGAVRRERSKRARRLDLHNLIGITALAWLLVVGATGFINSWGQFIVIYWRMDQIAAMGASYAGKPGPSSIAPAQEVLASARAALPGMKPAILSYPGSMLATEHHYGVYMVGGSPLRRYLFRPVLVDAATAEVTAVAELPWYMKGLLLSQPLHFGDYGGLPLKILWAVLNMLSIILLWTGLQLWWRKRAA